MRRQMRHLDTIAQGINLTFQPSGVHPPLMGVEEGPLGPPAVPVDGNRHENTDYSPDFRKRGVWRLIWRRPPSSTSELVVLPRPTISPLSNFGASNRLFRVETHICSREEIEEGAPWLEDTCCLQRWPCMHPNPLWRACSISTKEED